MFILIDTVIPAYPGPLWRKTYQYVMPLNVKISEIITIILMDYVLRSPQKTH